MISKNFRSLTFGIGFHFSKMKTGIQKIIDSHEKNAN